MQYLVGLTGIANPAYVVRIAQQFSKQIEYQHAFRYPLGSA